MIYELSLELSRILAGCSPFAKSGQAIRLLIESLRPSAVGEMTTRWFIALIFNSANSVIDLDLAKLADKVARFVPAVQLFFYDFVPPGRAGVIGPWQAKNHCFIGDPGDTAGLNR